MEIARRWVYLAWAISIVVVALRSPGSISIGRPCSSERDKKRERERDIEERHRRETPKRGDLMEMDAVIRAVCA